MSITSMTGDKARVFAHRGYVCLSMGCWYVLLMYPHQSPSTMVSIPAPADTGSVDSMHAGFPGLRRRFLGHNFSRKSASVPNMSSYDGIPSAPMAPINRNIDASSKNDCSFFASKIYRLSALLILGPMAVRYNRGIFGRSDTEQLVIITNNNP